MLLIIFVYVLVTPIFSRSLPPEIKKCQKSDPNLSQCLDKYVLDGIHQLKNGNKALGILSLDPVFIPLVQFGDTNARAVSLKQHYENVKIYGLPNITIFDTRVNFSDTNCYWNFKAKSEEASAEAYYKMNGQVLVFPLNGHGQCEIHFYDSVLKFNSTCEKYMKHDKKHLRLRNVKLKIEPKKVVVDFQNIIDGNEQLSREVVKTMNENGMEIYKEIGSIFEDAIGRVGLNMINEIFSRVPEDELFLP